MTPLLNQLRETTRPHHEQTEQLLYSDDLRAGMLSVSQYTHLLLIHGSFHQALEQAIDQHADFFQDYEPDLRRKTSWLQADLESIHQPMPPQIDLFAGWSPASLLGAAYVGEGSMLGGKTVFHLLQQSSPLQPLLENARFYRGYGSETGALWRSFGLFVADKQASVDSSGVVKGACKAFQLYQDLFEKTQPLAV